MEIAGTEIVDPEAAESGLSTSSSLKQFEEQCCVILLRLKFYTEMCLNSLVFEFLPVDSD